jgi:hypothetical protein
MCVNKVNMAPYLFNKHPSKLFVNEMLDQSNSGIEQKIKTAEGYTLTVCAQVGTANR